MGEGHRIAKLGSVQEVRELFRRVPAKLDERDENGETPLLLALAAGREDVAAALLELGASPNRSDRHGGTPLMAAARLGLFDSVKRLVSLGADVSAGDAVDGLTALDWASLSNHEDVVEWLQRWLAEQDAG
jgi:ankyrin repeat protein